mmetsp:Transcript_126646/g.405492  ORF Transcript_126646/g.405492 Transcript_126646/m.405492 type:complete len:201 (-) Transcript_126646:762-1364(-)
MESLKVCASRGVLGCTMRWPPPPPRPGASVVFCPRKAVSSCKGNAKSCATACSAACAVCAPSPPPSPAPSAAPASQPRLPTSPPPPPTTVRLVQPCAFTTAGVMLPNSMTASTSCMQSKTSSSCKPTARMDPTISPKRPATVATDASARYGDRRRPAAAASEASEAHAGRSEAVRSGNAAASASAPASLPPAASRASCSA